MAGQTGPDDPVDLVSSDKVPPLQRPLWAAAKRVTGRRFHASYDPVCRTDILHEACKRVRRESNAYLRVPGRRGLKLHPDKTRRVDLTPGSPGFDSLGCHLHKRMSERLWEQMGLRRYDLQRWPGYKAMNRVRELVRELTPRSRGHRDMRGGIVQLNPVLRGWGQYFRTGNAADHFGAVDGHVVQRLRSLRVARAGRHLRAGQLWDRDCFENLGLRRLRGTIRHPGNPPVIGRTA
jgi:RNA-directed DNA polymerase